jgi:hypothetical protein
MRSVSPLVPTPKYDGGNGEIKSLPARNWVKFWKISGAEMTSKKKIILTARLKYHAGAAPVSLL